MRVFQLALGVLALAAAADLDASLGPDGSYTLSVRGAEWLKSGATFVTVDGKKFSTADGTLKPSSAGVVRISGSDPTMGAFTGEQITWAAGSGGATRFVTSVKRFEQQRAVMFEQAFPDGARGTAPADGDAKQLSNGALSGFPAFLIEDAPSDAEAKGFLTFSGRFLEASKAAAWGARSTPPSGRSAGPLALFDRKLTTVMLSPASEFMAAMSQVQQSKGGAPPTLVHGVMGSITSLPKGFSLRTVARLGAGSGAETGITGAVKAWGTMLLKAFGKDAAAARAQDPTLHQLGYSTDNGAYYYGRPEPHKTMQQTMLDVAADAKASNVPLRTVLLDSWWYYKGIGGGVKNWTARPDIFPDGIQSMVKATGWPVQAHNRYWSADTDYARQNGGDYDFIVEERMAIPTTQVFWDDLMANKTAEWGLAVYEQDWLYNEFEGLNATLQNATLGRDWLMQMGAGAAKVNVTVQYCMSYARMVMQTVEIPAVSQFRAGDDYGPGQSTGCGFPYCVYNIGTSSIIAWALGLAPAKDDFWSTTDEGPDSPYRNTTTEPFNEMEAAIASYSTGPVQPSDKVGSMNGTLLRMTCAADGTLLQPSRPAATIDAALAFAAFGAGSGGPKPTKNNNPAVWATHTAVGDAKYAHVLVIGLNATWSLRPADIPLDLAPAAGGLVAYSGYGAATNVSLSVGKGGSFAADSPIVLKPCLYSDFAIWHVAPRSAATGWALLGEMGKFVPVSEARVLAVADEGDGIAVTIAGVPNEAVVLTFLDKANSVHTASCTFAGSGSDWTKAKATCTSQSCSCK